MTRRAPVAAVGLLLCLLAAPATAETAAQALQGFGILGTWSPDCNGPIRVTYALHPDAAPTSTAVVNGAEQAVSEIQEAARVGTDRIRWTGIYRKFAPLNVRQAAWMPAPGETWETVLEMVGGKIRSIESQEKGGAKVLVRDGFYYVADKSVANRPILWRKTTNPTRFFGRCPAASR